MKKAAVIYWSGTGNTEAMANAVLEGMKSAGADAVLLTASDVDGSAVGGYDAVALGCPAMGSEVLEDMEFEPMFDGCKSSLKGKRVALFGSYGECYVERTGPVALCQHFEHHEVALVECALAGKRDDHLVWNRI